MENDPIALASVFISIVALGATAIFLYIKSDH